MIQPQVKVKYREEARSEKRTGMAVSSLSHLLSTAPRLSISINVLIFCIIALGNSPGILVSSL